MAEKKEPHIVVKDMILAENVALPLEQYTRLSPRQIRKVVSLKLSLVGLGGFENYYPSQISGGMRKRVGVARAMAMDPQVLFFDEPSAGLESVSARPLDDLILQLQDSLKTTGGGDPRTVQLFSCASSRALSRRPMADSRS